MIRVLLADDHDLFSDLVRVALQRDGNVQVATTPSLHDAIAHLTSSAPVDLVILDIRMPGMTGPQDIDRVRKLANGIPVAVISGAASAEEVRAYLNAGAAGYIPKTLSLNELTSAITILAEGDTYLPRDMIESAVVSDALPALPSAGHRKLPELFAVLTPRELELLEQLVQGWSNKQIARNLSIAEPTVKSHLMNLFRKIGARNRTDAVRLKLSAVN